jgi:hypothetical protein
MRYQRTRKHRFQGRQWGLLCGVLLLLVLLNPTTTAPMANASILPLGPCPNIPPGSQGPPCDATGIAAGTLLAALTAPFVTTLGTTAGTLVSAVYRESGGTLDFYYQVIVNTTATNCGHTGQDACDAIGRETDTDFTTVLTQLAFRKDGAALPGGVFVNGDTPPQFADRGSSGDVIGYDFNPLNSEKIFPGHASNVLVVSTNATNFTAGHASVIDGGATTISSFEPVRLLLTYLPLVRR